MSCGEAVPSLKSLSRKFPQPLSRMGFPLFWGKFKNLGKTRFTIARSLMKMYSWWNDTYLQFFFGWNCKAPVFCKTQFFQFADQIEDLHLESNLRPHLSWQALNSHAAIFFLMPMPGENMVSFIFICFLSLSQPKPPSCYFLYRCKSVKLTTATTIANFLWLDS